jgi:medium-chain acyl-[acyl-carrier-protein] hydrolase
MTALTVSDRWLPWFRPKPGAKVRLFCFPYAGGGASVYRAWGDCLPGPVDVCAVQLPGRETRFREHPFARLPLLVEALAGALRPHLDRPFAFFGHSLGALVAFELSRRLQRDHGPRPVRLFVSGCGAPQTRVPGRAIHALPPAEFREELRRLNGTPADLLDNDELMDLMLPTLRADFGLCETYAYVAGPPLACPVTALGGLGDDAVSRQELDAWREQTTGPFRVRMLPGDHFFLHSARPLLTQALAQELLRAVDGAEPADLGEGDVHVWGVGLDQPEESRADLRRLLSADEEARARRFHFPRDRDRFIVCRAALRQLLGRYLSRAPGQLRFAYGAHGKPALAEDAAATGVRFNVAHSQGRALIAVTRGREVGVDLEWVRPDVATEQLAATVFSARELEALRALPPQLRTDAFFRCWTRKEAYLKATGTGLAASLDRFDVTLHPGEPAALLANRDDPTEVRRWSLGDLVPGPGFVGALAVAGQSWRAQCREWNGSPAAPEHQRRGRRALAAAPSGGGDER